MEKKNVILPRISDAIIRARFIIFALFAVAAVFCVLMLGKVKINSDLTHFLPEETETRRGIAVMSEEFKTYGMAEIMLSDVDYGEASEAAQRIREIDHVASVSFDGSAEHIKDGYALISVSFDLEPDDERAIAALDEVEDTLSGDEYDISTSVGRDFSSHLAGEMVGVMIIAAIVIIAVLLFTSRSYFEVVIYVIVFAVAALLNMGTNFIFGEISSITNSVAVILQLALAIDYAIIFAHRYQDEASCGGGDPLASALAHSIVEISSSSLTTVSGLAALTLMQFRFGYDLGIVLAKGILCSMLTVLLLMPGLVSLFPRMLRATSHRPLVPSIERWGRFLAKRRFIFIIIFVLIIPFAVFFSLKTEYAFSDTSVTEIVSSPERDSEKKIREVFSPSTSVAVIVPSGDYEAERSLTSELSGLEGTKSAAGIAAVPFGDGYLSDGVSTEDVLKLFPIDADSTELLFKAYSFEVEGDLSAFSKDMSGKKIPLVDLALYLFDKIDDGAVALTDEQRETVEPLRRQLEFGADQLKGKSHDRIVVSTSYPAEGEESVAYADRVKETALKYYDDVLVTGDITSARDLAESYRSDSVLISILTVAFVFLILLATFRSPVAAAILVVVIEVSIQINFSIPYFLGMRCSFVTQMITSAIQMGATIDYAIVMMNRYLALRTDRTARDAAATAVKESFPTVITSGLIMSAAGLLIAFRVSDVYVGHIGFAVGRGALISVILVLTALPQLILLFDRAIGATVIKRKIKNTERR